MLKSIALPRFPMSFWSDVMGANGHHHAGAAPPRVTLAVKRMFDVFVSGLALIVLTPLLLIVAVAVKLDSPGPVFFRQTRVGRGGQTFRMFKFRSMIDGAAKVGPALTVRADPRITRLGALLREFKIDELPQLINVLAGSMSFVGPRPEVPEYMDFYTSMQRRIILSMRPGITDYAAILFRDEARILSAESDPAEVYRHRIMPIKFALYERYSREIGLLNDLRIILATLALLYSSKTVAWFDLEQEMSRVALPETAQCKPSEGKPIERSR